MTQVTQVTQSDLGYSSDLIDSKWLKWLRWLKVTQVTQVTQIDSLDSSHLIFIILRGHIREKIIRDHSMEYLFSMSIFIGMLGKLLGSEKEPFMGWTIFSLWSVDNVLGVRRKKQKLPLRHKNLSETLRQSARWMWG